MMCILFRALVRANIAALVKFTCRSTTFPKDARVSLEMVALLPRLPRFSLETAAKLSRFVLSAHAVDVQRHLRGSDGATEKGPAPLDRRTLHVALAVDGREHYSSGG